ncbi:hypothetical protein PIB30_008316 [Stylosanthes scabra]|uniref:Uncharacterized protein n=1 Tax=Stylosanthes scabra TaxID=79078 RepID=A0ABU6S4Q7_9FABA|nr:hypothetical protein [Stylosanthes scabra]
MHSKPDSNGAFVNSKKKKNRSIVQYLGSEKTEATNRRRWQGKKQDGAGPLRRRQECSNQGIEINTAEQSAMEETERQEARLSSNPTGLISEVHGGEHQRKQCEKRADETLQAMGKSGGRKTVMCSCSNGGMAHTV